MAARAFRSEFIRTITRKPGRFLALVAIVALGAGFYAGLRMTAPDMDRALDAYLDASCAYDLRVVSTLGLSDDDIEALAGLEGASVVEPALECDAEAQLNGSKYTMRFHSLPGSAQPAERKASAHDLNQLTVVAGRLPEAAGECAICADRVMDAPFGLGDVIEVERDGAAASQLEGARYAVVGLIRSPYYASQVSLGTSALGSGIVQQYVFVPAAQFKRTMPYTEAFIEVEGARELANASEEYERLVGQTEARIREIAPERERLRSSTLRDLSSLRFRDELTSYEGMLDLLEFQLENPRSQTRDATCEWLVMGRDKNVGAASFTGDAERVDHIASVFPFVFFLVAALVALTTMTRMVDEERMLIGTFKALGYSRATISAKYLAYALLASGIGSLLGISLLGWLLPAVIMNAYAIMYDVPAAGYPLDARIAALSAGLSVGICLIATAAATAATLREKPAALLLPPAPKSGKRILLERAGGLWRRMSFSWKVCARNLFRYKKRLFMTLIGIAGCTALLLTGLGLHDAINDIIDVQYTDIVHHNATIALDGSAGEDERAALEDALLAEGLAGKTTPAQVTTMLASGPRAQDKRCDVVVPADPSAFADMMCLRTREGHETLELADGQAIVNEKLASDLGVTVGDTVVLAEQDAMGNATQTRHEFRIAGLAEIYIYNYLFVNESTYQQATGATAKPTTLFANIAPDASGRDALVERLAATGAVKTVAFNDETIETYRTMLRSVDLIVVVLVVSAAALAFIVLYNLTNINIEERVREIATLKVLGFTRRETYAYIAREVLVLSLLGCLAGLVLGMPLESFVVTTAEVDQVMFGRAIHPASFAAAFVLTLVFALASLVLMLPKLNRIDMVESLKARE